MFNQITLIGRIVRDPIVNTTKEGKSVTTLTLAVRRSYKNSQGEYDTDFIPITAWEKLAETSGDYCTKGSLVCITGRVHMRNVEGSGENQRLSLAEITAENITFLQLKRTAPPTNNGAGEVPFPGQGQANTTMNVGGGANEHTTVPQ